MDEDVLDQAPVGTADAGATQDGGATAAADANAGATTAATNDAAESFFDPTNAPPELKAHWRTMQAAFTRKMQALSAEKRQLGEKVGAYDRLMNDPAYARQIVMEAAPRLGIKVLTDEPTSGDGNASDGGAPPEFVDLVKSQLAPELQWMAQSLANTQWAAQRQLLQPLLDRQKAEAQSRRGEEYEALADRLSQRVPNWSEHEDEMMQLLDFMSSDRMNHPVYGSKLEVLYNAVTANSAATQEAIRRMSAAGRARTVTGRAEASTVPNLAEAIKKAPTMQDAFKIAADDAIQRVTGGK